MSDRVSSRALSSIAGQINAMYLAVGNSVRLFTRAMYAQIEARKSWEEEVVLHDDVRREIEFWLAQVDSRNGLDMWFKSSAVRVAYSDASDSGYGGYIVELGPDVAACGTWQVSEISFSSTMRELLAV